MSLMSEARLVLSPPLRRFAETESLDAALLREQLDVLLLELAQDLALPIDWTITVQSGEPEQQEEAPGYELWFDGRKCRGPSFCPDAAEVTAPELARRLARLACDNRELLVTLSLAKKVCDEWLGEPPDSLRTISPAAVLKLFSLLVRRFFRIERGRSTLMLLRERGGAGWNVEEMFEHSVGTPPAAQLGIRIGAPRTAEPPPADADIALAALQEAPLRARLFDEMGLILPRVDIFFEDTLRPDEVRLRLNDVRLPPFLGVTAGEVVAELQRHAAAWITNFSVDFALSRLYPVFPALIDAAHDRFGTTRIACVLRGLLDEGVSIRDLRGILEALLEMSGTSSVSAPQEEIFLLDPGTVLSTSGASPTDQLPIQDLVEHCRRVLRRAFLYSLTKPARTLDVYLLPPELEGQLRQIPPEGWSDQEVDQLIKGLAAHIGPGPQSPSATAILTAYDVRRCLRKLIEKYYPFLPVLSRQELDPLFSIRHVATLAAP